MQDNGGWQRGREPFGSAVFGGRTTQVKAGGDKVCRIRRDRERAIVPQVCEMRKLYSPIM